MKVSELINELQQHPGDMDVVVTSPKGYHLAFGIREDYLDSLKSDVLVLTTTLIKHTDNK